MRIRRKKYSIQITFLYHTKNTNPINDICNLRAINYITSSRNMSDVNRSSIQNITRSHKKYTHTVLRRWPVLRWRRDDYHCLRVSQVNLSWKATKRKMKTKVNHSCLCMVCRAINKWNSPFISIHPTQSTTDHRLMTDWWMRLHAHVLFCLLAVVSSSNAHTNISFKLVVTFMFLSSVYI